VPEGQVSDDAVSVVGLFNEAINAGNVAALAELMTDTHRSIDMTTGNEMEGGRGVTH
jgi:hypothetical protein